MLAALRDQGGFKILELPLFPNVLAAHRPQHASGFFEAGIEHDPFSLDLLSGVAQGLARPVVVEDDLSSMIDGNDNVEGTF